MAKRGLGKGLGALIPTADDSEAPAPKNNKPKNEAPATRTTKAAAPVAVEVANYAEIDIDSVRPNPQQPRTVFDEDALAELTFSIKEIGLLQPIVVRPLDPPEDGVAYELIAGERRLRASRQAGLANIPAIIRITDDSDM